MRITRLTVTTVLAGVVSLAYPATAGAEAFSSLSSAAGEASGIYIRVNDPAVFLEDTIFAPPEISIGYARAGLDRTGAGTALAAAGYSEYMNLLGAVPELGPAFLPPEALPIFELLVELLPPGLAESFSSLTQASVRGTPPQAKDSTYLPGTSAELGVMRAQIEAGPLARATSTYADFPVSLLARASAVDTQTVVSTAGTGRRVEVTSVLRDVTIAEVLEIDAIRVTAVANADGAEGIAEGSVVIDGVTVAGLPAVIDQDGVRFGDEVVPLSIGPINDVLASAGIHVTAPGSVTSEPDGGRSFVLSEGPTIDLVTVDGQEFSLTLGRALASSDLVLLDAAPAATLPIPPAAASSPATVGASTTGAPVYAQSVSPPAASAAAAVADAAPTAPAAPGQPAVLALDQDNLVLAGEDVRNRMEDAYLLLLVPMLVLAASGTLRPWRSR